MTKKMLQPMLLLFANLDSWTQTNLAHLIRTDLIPPSPTTAGFARYSVIPINLNYSYANGYLTMARMTKPFVYLFSFIKSNSIRSNEKN